MERNDPVGEDAVHWQVEVYWSDEEEWYSGEIVEFDQRQKSYQVHYDDGDIQWEELSSKQIKFLRRIPQQNTQHDVDSSIVAALDPPSSEEDSNYDKEEQGYISPEDKEEETKHDQVYISPEDNDEETNDEQVYNSPEVNDEECDVNDRSDSEEHLCVAEQKSFLADEESVMNPRACHSILSNRPIAGYGVGKISGEIHCANEITNLSGSCDPFVKVLYVSPGPQQDVMLRCKTAVHTTDVIPDCLDPIWEGEQFHFQIDPPPLSQKKNCDWKMVQGDLLIVLYDSNGGLRNEFIGQTTFRLNSLLEIDEMDNVMAGLHKKQILKLKLKSRTGTFVGATITMSAQLTLPVRNDSDVASKGSINIKSLKKKKISVSSTKKSKQRLNSSAINRKRDERRIEQENKRMKKKTVKGNLKCMESLSSSNKHLSTSTINRRKFEEKLAKENIEMAKRLQKFKKSSVAVEKKTTPRKETNVECLSYKKQCLLVDEIDKLKKEVALLENRVSSEKMTLSRLQISSKKNLNKLKNSKKNISSILVNPPSDSSSGSHQANDLYADGSNICDEETHLLESENKSLKKTNKSISKEIVDIRVKKKRIEIEIQNLRSILHQSRKRQAFLKTNANERQNTGNLDEQEFEKAFSQILELKSYLSMKESQHRCTTTDKESKQDDYNIELKQNLDKKLNKSMVCSKELDEIKKEYQELVSSNLYEKLTKDRSELQRAMFLCEREEKC